MCFLSHYIKIGDAIAETSFRHTTRGEVMNNFDIIKNESDFRDSPVGEFDVDYYFSSSELHTFFECS